MRITVTGASPCDLALARAAMREAAAHARLPADAAVTLAFVDDARVRELNSRYRGIRRVTDVLSFGQRLPEGARGPDAAARLRRDVDGSLDVGDVVIAGAVAARQARRRRVSLAAEVAFLAAHGVLHLLGYEDETSAGYREMRRRGEEAMRRARTSSSRLSRRCLSD